MLSLHYLGARRQLCSCPVGSFRWKSAKVVHSHLAWGLCSLGEGLAVFFHLLVLFSLCPFIFLVLPSRAFTPSPLARGNLGRWPGLTPRWAWGPSPQFPACFLPHVSWWWLPLVRGKNWIWQWVFRMIPHAQLALVGRAEPSCSYWSSAQSLRPTPANNKVLLGLALFSVCPFPPRSLVGTVAGLWQGLGFAVSLPIPSWCRVTLTASDSMCTHPVLARGHWTDSCQLGCISLGSGLKKTGRVCACIMVPWTERKRWKHLHKAVQNQTTGKRKEGGNRQL